MWPSETLTTSHHRKLYDVMLLMHQGRYRPDMDSDNWTEGMDGEQPFSMAVLVSIPDLLLLVLGPYLQEQFQEELAGFRSKAGIPLHALFLGAAGCQVDFFVLGGQLCSSWLSLALYPLAIYLSAKVAVRDGLEPYHRYPAMLGFATMGFYRDLGWLSPGGMGLLLGGAFAIGLSQHAASISTSLGRGVWDSISVLQALAIQRRGAHADGSFMAKRN